MLSHFRSLLLVLMLFSSSIFASTDTCKTASDKANLKYPSIQLALMQAATTPLEIESVQETFIANQVDFFHDAIKICYQEKVAAKTLVVNKIDKAWKACENQAAVEDIYPTSALTQAEFNNNSLALEEITRHGPALWGCYLEALK